MDKKDYDITISPFIRNITLRKHDLDENGVLSDSFFNSGILSPLMMKELLIITKNYYKNQKRK